MAEKECKRIFGHELKLGHCEILFITGVNGSYQRPPGTVTLQLNINRLAVSRCFHVFQTLSCTIFLGMDFLEDKKVQIDMDNKTISAYDCLSVCALKSILPKDGVAKSIVCVSISAQLECKLPFTFITTKSNKRYSTGAYGLFTKCSQPSCGSNSICAIK